MSSWSQAHASLWYKSSPYRLTWLILPQLAVACLAGVISSMPAGKAIWGHSTIFSRQEEIKYADLLTRAGNGDQGAFTQLSKDADAGNGTAQSLLANLYDPSTTVSFQSNPVTADADKALKLFQPAADSGYRGGQAGMTRLLLGKVYNHYDLERGCKYGTAFYNNPDAVKINYAGFESALIAVAGCYFLEGSGIPANYDTVADIDLKLVAAKFKPIVDLLGNVNSSVDPRIVTAIQRNLKGRNAYNGPIDGKLNADLVTSVHTLAGQATPTDSNRRPSDDANANNNPPGSNNPPSPALKDIQALATSAIKSVADADKLRMYADAGDRNAQLFYGMLYSPVDKMSDRAFPPDAARSVAYLEPLAKRGVQAAAMRVGLMYDVGYATLPRNADKAAEMIAIDLELKDKQMVDKLDKETWGPGFWAALQSQLAKRNLYLGTIVDRKNDRTMASVRQLAGG